MGNKTQSRIWGSRYSETLRKSDQFEVKIHGEGVQNVRRARHCRPSEYDDGRDCTKETDDKIEWLPDLDPFTYYSRAFPGRSTFAQLELESPWDGPLN